MLLKRLKFEDDTLQILRSMIWDSNGLLGKISGQLDRKMYVEVNKALEAMGGKWDRKAGGHVFKIDPRPMVEGLLENGVLEVEKDGFFETPVEVTRRMVELAPYMGGFVLEPSAGLGAIALNIGVPRKLIVCVEKNKARCNVLENKGFAAVINTDFLNYQDVDNYWPIKHVYMNPPFENGQDIDHVKHAYQILKIGGILVAVMSEGVFFRRDRKAENFRMWLEDVYGYSEKLPEGAFKASGTMVRARLVVIAKRYGWNDIRDAETAQEAIS